MGRKPLWEQNTHTWGFFTQNRVFQVLKVFYPKFFSIIMIHITHDNLYYTIFSPEPVLVPAFILLWQIQVHKPK